MKRQISAHIFRIYSRLLLYRWCQEQQEGPKSNILVDRKLVAMGGGSFVHFHLFIWGFICYFDPGSAPEHISTSTILSIGSNNATDSSWAGSCTRVADTDLGFSVGHQHHVHNGANSVHHRRQLLHNERAAVRTQRLVEHLHIQRHLRTGAGQSPPEGTPDKCNPEPPSGHRRETVSGSLRLVV